MNIDDCIDKSYCRVEKQLSKLEGLDEYVDFVVEQNFDKIYSTYLEGGAFRITEKNSPAIISIFRAAAQKIDTDVIPTIYIQRDESFTDKIVGFQSPSVILSSYNLENFNEKQLVFIAGRNMAAIKTNIYKIEFLADTICQFEENIPNELIEHLQVPLLHSKRLLQFFKDNVGLLINNDLNEVIRLFMIEIGYSKNPFKTTESEFINECLFFYQWAKENGVHKQISVLSQDGVWLKERVARLYKWSNKKECNYV